jgi:hypothetical protein
MLERRSTLSRLPTGEGPCPPPPPTAEADLRGLPAAMSASSPPLKMRLWGSGGVVAGMVSRLAPSPSAVLAERSGGGFKGVEATREAVEGADPASVGGSWAGAPGCGAVPEAVAVSSSSCVPSWSSLMVGGTGRSAAERKGDGDCKATGLGEVGSIPGEGRAKVAESVGVRGPRSLRWISSFNSRDRPVRGPLVRAPVAASPSIVPPYFLRQSSCFTLMAEFFWLSRTSASHGKPPKALHTLVPPTIRCRTVTEDNKPHL